MRSEQAGDRLPGLPHRFESVAQQHPDVSLAPVFRQAGDRRDSTHRNRVAIHKHREIVDAESGDDFAVLEQDARPGQFLEMAHPLPSFGGSVSSERVRDHEMHALQLILAGGTDFGCHGAQIVTGRPAHWAL